MLSRANAPTKLLKHKPRSRCRNSSMFYILMKEVSWCRSIIPGSKLTCPKSSFSYLMSTAKNPLLGYTQPRLALTSISASVSVMCNRFIRYAMTIVADRETPIAQWTKTGLEWESMKLNARSNASLICNGKKKKRRRMATGDFTGRRLK